MPTSARRRKPVDVQRLAAAVSHPGIDPRTWLSAGRVEQVAGSSRWEGPYGWVVDVTYYGTGLDQESDNPSRVLGSGPTGDGYGEFFPPASGSDVLVGVPDGAPENSVVLGALRNSTDHRAPERINGKPINGDLIASTLLEVSPYDTEIKRSPHNRREEYDGDLVIEADSISLVSDAVHLGSDDPPHSAVLGEPNNAALESLLSGLETMAVAFTGMTGPLAPFQAVGADLLAAITSVRGALPGTLSKVVKLG